MAAVGDAGVVLTVWVAMRRERAADVMAAEGAWATWVSVFADAGRGVLRLEPWLVLVVVVCWRADPPVELVEPSSACAVAGRAAMTNPAPRATARPPTRPM